MHAFHPDHNNLDEDYSKALAEGRESFTISRYVDLTFLSEDPQGLEIAGWGDTHMGGIYQEWVEGLHREPILTQGHFRLVRVSRLGELTGL